MSKLFPLPENRNFLAQFNWKLFIKKCPNVSYFGQGVNLPSVALPAADQPTPFVNVPHPGDHVRYDDFVVRFVVDEDLANWLEIHDWLTDLGFPDRYDQFKNIKNSDGELPSVHGGLYSPALLTLTTNARNPNLEFEFEGLWPTALSGLELNATDNDVQYLTATAIFRYTLYRRKKV